MPFRIHEHVRIKEWDTLRGGETAIVKQVLPVRCGMNPIREYLLEFQNYPARSRSKDDRFLYCIYREEQLISVDEA